MEFLGGDTHLATQAEFTAVGKTSGGVDVHRRGIHRRCETVSSSGIGGDDGLRVMGGMSGDVSDGFFHVLHHANGEDIIQKFRVEIGVTRRGALDDCRG